MKTCECGCGEVTPIAKKTKSSLGHKKGEHIRFISGHNSRLRIGPLHHRWKGEHASYMAIHNWLRRHKQKSGVCSDCGKSARTDWANISGEYRRELGDYRELCRGCHVAQDRERDPVSGQFL